MTKPFTPVAMVKFRKRFPAKRLDSINERILQAETKKKPESPSSDKNDDDIPPGGPSAPTAKIDSAPTTDGSAKPNQGTLLLDATCVPADIHFPTDVGLLHEAREKLEEMIDTLHEASGKTMKKPRTYREKARRDYLLLSKQRSPRKQQIRKAIKKQLQYVRRDLRMVEQLLEPQKGQTLSRRHSRFLETIRILLEQQTTMYQTKNHRIQDRIVNLYQPHVRPIVRGKAGAPVEFGAKVAISLEKGYSRIEQLSWDAYNEAGTFVDTVERYKTRHGHYPQVVLADRIYRNRDNLAYCKKWGIRLSGPKLGRPAASATLKKAEKQIERQDARSRNAVEGKCGEGKRKYSLSRISARLKETAECMIAMQFLVMNLEHKLRVCFAHFLGRLFSGEYIVAESI